MRREIGPDIKRTTIAMCGGGVMRCACASICHGGGRVRVRLSFCEGRMTGQYGDLPPWISQIPSDRQ